MSNEKQYRYPGTRPFTENERNLFFGRNEDIERLHKQIRLEQLLVLIGKSGLGKSSLLNAGVLPLLKESSKFVPIPVRIGLADKEVSPAQVFLNKMAPLLDFDNLLWTKALPDYKNTWQNPQTDESFWLACKSLQLQYSGQTILLVFDQFEELFLHSENNVARFAQLLAALLFGEMPQTLQNRIYEMLEKDENAFTPAEIDALFEKVNVKVVISIRSDKMSLLNRLKTYIPQILQKTYELQPLSIAQAQEAMLNPASAEGDFISPAFAYEPQAEEKIINYLSSDKEKPIETFQLQLICQFCENTVIRTLSGADRLENLTLSGASHTDRLRNKIELRVEDLGDLSTIFTRHYDTLINEIADPTERLAAQCLIEENLIIEGNRVPLPDKVITSKHQISAGLLQRLVNSRLLRSEPNNVGGFSYEISHDTLVVPIMASYKIRFEREEKERIAREEKEKLQKLLAERKRQRKIIAMVGSVAVVAVVAFIFAVVLYFDAQKARSKAEAQEKIATQKEQEAKEALDKLKSSEFSRLTNDANQLCKDLKFADAVAKLKEAFNWTNDSADLQQRIDSLMRTAGKEILFRQLMQQASDNEKAEKNWQQAINLYQQAADLDFNKQLAQSKKNNLQGRFNSKLAYYKQKAREYLGRGDAFKQHALQNFIAPGLELKPGDPDLMKLKVEAEK